MAAVARALPPAIVIRSLPIRLLSSVTGADRRTVERWRSGTSPRARYRARVDELGAVLAILGDGISEAGKRAWLEARNPFLRWERPADLLAEGRFDDVRGAAEAYQAGDSV
ncbi:MAG TPA: hypothetical protein VGQ47_01470 [Candidatus Limnocylindrales bacterium]|jgi:hypothetical protein|nr:hypothetical protein [Candidatus Limnocylindrales bacterium]